MSKHEVQTESRDAEAKAPYSAPKLVRYGSVEEITAGPKGVRRNDAQSFP